MKVYNEINLTFSSSLSNLTLIELLIYDI